MIVFSDPAEVPHGFGPSAVTIGKFDGVHAGHRAVLTELIDVARSEGLASVAVTFDRHPLAYHAPEKCPTSLVSLQQKVELLERVGLDATVVLPYGRELASQSADEFVERLLVGRLNAKVVLVGRDFRYGAGNSGDIDTLIQQGERLGFRVLVIDDVMPEDERRVSSTWIRELLQRGDVDAAGRLLGHFPAVSGEVVHGEKRGRDLGFPTANLTAQVEGFVPADGVYAGWLIDEGAVDAVIPDGFVEPRRTARYPAAISVGTNPTFPDVRSPQVEAYAIDETDLDLYGHRVEVQFVSRLRGMVAFDGVDALVAQMADDVADARTALS